MESTNPTLGARLQQAMTTLGDILRELWEAAEHCSPCCGIRLAKDQECRTTDMPTPGSCCGVRL